MECFGPVQIVSDKKLDFCLAKCPLKLCYPVDKFLLLSAFCFCFSVGNSDNKPPSQILSKTSEQINLAVR